MPPSCRRRATRRLLGIPGDNTYSNLAEAQRTFWRTTVLPLVERVASELSLWLRPVFRNPVELRVDIDTLPALASEREALWASLEKTSFLTDAEKRTIAGFSPTPATDDPATKRFNPNQTRVPAGQPGGGQWTDGNGGENSERGEDNVQLIAKKPGGIAKELWKLTVRQFVSQYCKGSIREVLPGELDDLSIAEVIDLAKGGDKRARTCKNLLERQRFRKD